MKCLLYEEDPANKYIVKLQLGGMLYHRKNLQRYTYLHAKTRVSVMVTK